jgi:hypothetical protein
MWASTPLGTVISTSMSLFHTAVRKRICQEFPEIDYWANYMRPCLVWGYIPLIISTERKRITARRVPSAPRFSSLSAALVIKTWLGQWAATAGLCLARCFPHPLTLHWPKSPFVYMCVHKQTNTVLKNTIYRSSVYISLGFSKNPLSDASSIKRCTSNFCVYVELRNHSSSISPDCGFILKPKIL